MYKPREDPAAVTAMASCAACLQVSFIIGLHCISLRAFDTFPLLVGAMFPSIMFLDAHKVAESVCGVVMKARPLWTNVNSLVRS